MSYRKVGCIEQIYYMIKYIIVNGNPRWHGHPKIKRIYVNGKRYRKYTYDREEGVIEFDHPFPEGTEIKVVYKDPPFWRKKRGKENDNTGIE